MDIGRIFRTFWFRMTLSVLVSEVVLVALAWLLHRQVSVLQHLRFGDLLFTLGVIICFMAIFWMRGRPYDANPSINPGGPAFSTQASKEEQRILAHDSAMRQKAVGIFLFALGLLTILVSLGFTYLIH
ncbi:MAG: hypothetical protein JW726_08155 [Anaerolineales bacterium]|nr:hypothetical protein [Anaerolineales bacterium]